MLSTSLSANGVMFSMRFIIASVLAGVLFLGAMMVKQAMISADGISQNISRRSQMLNDAMQDPQNADVSTPVAVIPQDSRPSKIVIIHHR